MATKGLRHVLDGYKVLDLAIIRQLTVRQLFAMMASDVTGRTASDFSGALSHGRWRCLSFALQFAFLFADIGHHLRAHDESRRGRIANSDYSRLRNFQTKRFTAIFVKNVCVLEITEEGYLAAWSFAIAFLISIGPMLLTSTLCVSCAAITGPLVQVVAFLALS